MGAINWFLWIGGGVAIAAGVVLLTWAMLGDRIRGGRRKRRCPRCWYDMSGVPGLTCPECGREARNERRLHRTRRRWGWGAAAALAMAGGAALGLLGRYSAEVAPIVLPVLLDALASSDSTSGMPRHTRSVTWGPSRPRPCRRLWRRWIRRRRASAWKP